MLPNGEIDWSTKYHPTPKTEQGFRSLREWARKRVIDMAIKRYFDGERSAKNVRYFYNDGKNLISEKEYRARLALNKSKLERTLSNLLRKGDKIVVPPQD